MVASKEGSADCGRYGAVEGVVVLRLAGASPAANGPLAQDLRPVEWPAMSEPDDSPKASCQASRMVRKGGFEPPRYCYRQPLKLVRLPVPPLPQLRGMST